MTREDLRRDLERRLRNAKQREQRARRDIDALRGELEWMAEEDSLALIRSWRGVIDWPALLRTEGRTMSLYHLGRFVLERMGLQSHGDWSDVGQAAITFGLAQKADATEAAAHIALIRSGLEALVPHLAEHPKDGLVWFGVHGENVDGYALNLRLSRDLATAQLVRMHYGFEDGTVECEGLGDALFHIQANHPLEDDPFEWMSDPNDAPGDTGDLLRRALAAFLEGCQSAGVPIDQTGLGRLAAA